jgi:hypothetical protein
MKRAIKLAAVLGVSFGVSFAASSSVYAQLEGTLFTQPEERAYLDYLRDEFLRNNAERGFDIEEATIPVIPGDEIAAPTGPTEVSFGGIMTRRDGSRSLWLNGALLSESELPGGMSLVGTGRDTSLRLTHEGKVYVLRPGQTVDLVASRVMEAYQRTPAASTNGASTTGAEAAVPARVEDAATDGDAAASPTEADPVDAVAAAVDTLDDEQIDALLEAIENRRQQQQAASDGAEEDDDEAADDAQ